VAVTSLLERLAAPWRARVASVSRRALYAFGLAVLLASAHLARLGTPSSRGLAAGVLAGLVLLSVYRLVRERRDWQSARRTIRRVLLPTDRGLGERALRALALAERARQRDFDGSRDLAEYHFARLLARASVEAVGRTAARRAARWRWAGISIGCCAVTALLVDPMRLAEGYNVMLAADGRAPWSMTWLESARVTAEPPGYLRLPDRQLVAGGLPSYEPAGTLLTVHGTPVRDGRQLVLTDGSREVPFVGDGAGGVVARWTVEQSIALRVAARFGEVTVVEEEPISVGVRPDAPPVVKVEGAPRMVRLTEIDRLKILYSASDDHGLRQIDVVLRAGDREDRRVLARLGGETTLERGGHALTSRDPFLRRMFLPVRVTVEARDNDPLTGPKWGRSEPITVVPPAVGEPETTRFLALLGARAMLVDFLAWQLGQPDPKDFSQAARTRARRAANELRAVITDTYGGLTVPEGLSSFLLGQMQVLQSRPVPGASAIRKTEDALLAVDVAIEALGRRDAQTVAKRLADVAEEAAEGAAQARETEQRARGSARLDGALEALQAGGQQLRQLSALGHDLGSVVLSELRRIERARSRDDMLHARLAAEHLAARLRRPRPSAAVVRGAGTEAGGIAGPSLWGEPSHADDLFDQLATELEQLAQEHACEISGVEQALAEAEQDADLDEFRDEARERAEAIRRAVADLPLPGAEPGSARATAALGREHAGAMAQFLERLSLADAVQSGRDATVALRDAQRKSRQRGLPDNWVDESPLREARRLLDKQLEWARRMLERLHHRAESRAHGALYRAGQREQGYAERAGNLSSRGRISETALPQEVINQLEGAGSLMRQAAQYLQLGNGARGLRLQRKAQRLLERSHTGRTTDEESLSESAERRQSSAGNQGGRGMRTDGTVPGAAGSQRADEFRKRVLEGLAREGRGRLAPAVKRYAEGLLR
jgi:hypothetical protein